MSSLTSEQFNAAVAAAISGVEHLYREVDLLFVGLREALAEDPEPLALKRGTLARSGKEDSKRVVVRHEYGALFEPAVDEDDGDDDEDAHDDDEAEDGAPRIKPGRHEVVAGQPLLAVRIAMYDKRKQSAHEPRVEYAVMSDWALGQGPSKPSDRFVLQSYMLKRIPRSLADRTEDVKGVRIATRAAARRKEGAKKGEDRRLSCVLPAGVASVSLYSLSSPDELEKLAEQMKSMWRSTVGA